MLPARETNVNPVRSNVVNTASAAMSSDLLRRARKMALILGSVMAIMIAFYFGAMPAAAWMVGIVWSLANLAAIVSIVRNVVTTETRDSSAIVVALALKFPVLYAAGIALLVVLKLPALWWIAGFTWPFFVVLMKSAGRMYLRLDETA